MKELQLQELTVKQKLGLCMTGFIRYEGKENDPCEEDYARTLDLIREHSLGALWILPTNPAREKIMADVKAAADYPILLITDAESGLGEHVIGAHNAIGCANNEELAYAFGKVTAVQAREMGYNVVCDPILDMTTVNTACGVTSRALGSDKYIVSKLATAIAQGMHDGGVLSVAKHYPSVMGDGKIDPHMAEKVSMETKEELLDYHLYPYLQLMKSGLLDGIMVGHERLPNIDPDAPASMSPKVIGVIREQGFDGFAITDALSMMGVVAKYGATTCKGLAIANGNDLALPWGAIYDDFQDMCTTYDMGLIPEERLNEAVRRVLEAQHKTLSLAQEARITPEDGEKIQRINREGTYAILDEGLTEQISREGKHFFVVLTEQSVNMDGAGKIDVDTMKRKWYDPLIMDQLKELFPNSTAYPIHEFSSVEQNWWVLEHSVDYDDVVFITFTMLGAYAGEEGFTKRVISLVRSLQVTKQVSTVVHFGNPFVLEELEHIPRILVGRTSQKSVEHTLEILAGLHSAKGVPTYDVKLK